MGEVSYGKAAAEAEQVNVWAAQALRIDRIGDAVMAVSLAADGPVNFP